MKRILEMRRGLRTFAIIWLVLVGVYAASITMNAVVNTAFADGDKDVEIVVDGHAMKASTMIRMQSSEEMYLQQNGFLQDKCVLDESGNGHVPADWNEKIILELQGWQVTAIRVRQASEAPLRCAGRITKTVNDLSMRLGSPLTVNSTAADTVYTWSLSDGSVLRVSAIGGVIVSYAITI